jgi:HSP20 family molecular chaperone IbpA
MRPLPVIPVVVKLVDSRALDARLEKLKERIRSRAYDLYCRRGKRGCETDDWKRAEGECCVAPLAGMADEENDIRITACVPGINASELVVDVLPNEIVIEADRNGEIERYKRFHLPVPIDGAHVEARMHGSELDVVAPKAKPGR